MKHDLLICLQISVFLSPAALPCACLSPGGGVLASTRSASRYLATSRGSTARRTPRGLWVIPIRMKQIGQGNQREAWRVPVCQRPGRNTAKARPLNMKEGRRGGKRRGSGGLPGEEERRKSEGCLCCPTRAKGGRGGGGGPSTSRTLWRTNRSSRRTLTSRRRPSWGHQKPK